MSRAEASAHRSTFIAVNRTQSSGLDTSSFMRSRSPDELADVPNTKFRGTWHRIPVTNHPTVRRPPRHRLRCGRQVAGDLVRHGGSPDRSHTLLRLIRRGGLAAHAPERSRVSRLAKCPFTSI